MKYLHKPSGLIAVKQSDNTYRISLKDLVSKKIRSTPLFDEFIPDYIVENGDDWTPIKEPLFATEDKVAVYENQSYVVLSTKHWNIEPRIAVSSNDRLADNYKRFSNKTAAEAYKKLHRPNYSEYQLFEAFKKHYPYTQIIIKGDFEDFLKSIS